MENLKMSETAREKLEEAMVAAFMEQYAQALDAGIDKTMEECAGEDFSPELDARCRELIQREYAKVKKQKRRKCILRWLRSAAIITVVTLSLFSVLFVTVEAFRLPIMNYFIEKTGRYWLLSGEKITKVTENFNPDDPLEPILSGDFALVDISGSWEDGNMVAVYENNSGSVEIDFFVMPANGTVKIFTENAEASQINIAGHDAYQYVEEEKVTVLWLDDGIDRMFSLIGWNASAQVMQHFAEELAVMFD